MKKKYLLLLSLFVSITVLAFSQQTIQLQEMGSIPFSNNILQNGVGKATLHKSTACGLDTVEYATGKAAGLRALSINNATSASAVAQYFDAPQAITISGLEFYGWSSSLPVVSVNVAIYLAGADSMPTGAPIASVSTPVDTTFGGGTLAELQKVATFGVPVTLSAPYVVVIENNSANNIALLSNDYTINDGAQEWLSSLKIGTAWLRSYTVNVGGVPFDADWLFHPLVTYDLSASLTVTDQCLSGATTLKTFTNASSGVNFNRMYNRAAWIGFPELSFVWDFGDASPEVNAVDTFHTYTGVGPFTLTLRDTLYGWTSFCYSDTTLLLIEAPSVEFSANVSSLQVLFYDSSLNVTPNSTWFWDFGDGNTSTMQNPSHDYLTAGNYTVCLTTSNECSSNTACKAVSVSCGLPSPAFSFSSSAYTASFTDATTGLLGGSLLWDFGDGNTSAMPNPDNTYALAGSYKVCLTATSVCGTDSTCQYVTIVCDTPVADFTTSTSLFDLDVTNNSTTTGTATYTWNYGDGNTAMGANPATHTYADTGTYTVCLNIVDDCGSVSTCKSVSIVCPGPSADFSVQMTGALSYVFFDSSAVTGTASYLWEYGDGSTDTDQNSDYTYASPGVYTVCLTVTDACGSDSSCTTVEILSSINELSAIGVSIYPNPSTGVITIQADKLIEDMNVSIRDAIGQEVFLKELGTTYNTIDLSSLSKGIYFIQLNQNGRQYVEKIVLQ